MAKKTKQNRFRIKKLVSKNENKNENPFDTKQNNQKKHIFPLLNKTISKKQGTFKNRKSPFNNKKKKVDHKTGRTKAQKLPIKDIDSLIELEEENLRPELEIDNLDEQFSEIKSDLVINKTNKTSDKNNNDDDIEYKKIMAEINADPKGIPAKIKNKEFKELNQENNDENLNGQFRPEDSIGCPDFDFGIGDKYDYCIGLPENSHLFLNNNGEQETDQNHSKDNKHNKDNKEAQNRKIKGIKLYQPSYKKMDFLKTVPREIINKRKAKQGERGVLKKLRREGKEMNDKKIVEKLEKVAEREERFKEVEKMLVEERRMDGKVAKKKKTKKFD